MPILLFRWSVTQYLIQLRQPLPGMLLHIDGSRHQWFQDERWYDLIVILDDTACLAMLQLGHLILGRGNHALGISG